MPCRSRKLKRLRTSKSRYSVQKAVLWNHQFASWAWGRVRKRLTPRMWMSGVPTSGLSRGSAFAPSVRMRSANSIGGEGRLDTPVPDGEKAHSLRQPRLCQRTVHLAPSVLDRRRRVGLRRRGSAVERDRRHPVAAQHQRQKERQGLVQGAGPSETAVNWKRLDGSVSVIESTCQLVGPSTSGCTLVGTRKSCSESHEGFRSPK